MGGSATHFYPKIGIPLLDMGQLRLAQDQQGLVDLLQ